MRALTVRQRISSARLEEQDYEVQRVAAPEELAGHDRGLALPGYFPDSRNQSSSSVIAGHRRLKSRALT